MVHTAYYLRAVLIGALAFGLACSDDSDDTNTETEPVMGEDGDGDGDTDADADGAGGMGGDDTPTGSGNDEPAMPMMMAGDAWNGVDAEVPDGEVLPIVFVHGFVGSAQQYQSQAMRWVMNGYPQEIIHAFDHDGAGVMFGAYVDGVDAFIDAVLEEHEGEYDQVYLIGHSRGTGVSTMFLSDEARRAKVAKYISLDGAPCPMSISCLAPNQARLEGQAHVEVATSAESFEMQYDFIMGEAAGTSQIVPQDGDVVISGRAVNFPAKHYAGP